MALKTSLVLTGEAASATAALEAMDKGMADVSAEAKRMEKAFADADRAIEQLAAAQTRAKEETLAAKVALKAGEISAKDYNARLLETKTALSLVETGHRGAVTALKQAQGAIAGAVPSTRAAAAEYLNFGRQVQDVAVQMQSGTDIGTIIAQQGGQVADAVAQMGGRFAGFASFMAGPFGTVILVTVSLIANLAGEMLFAGDEAEKTAAKSMSLSDALIEVRNGSAAALKALQDYNAEQDRARKNTDAMIKLDLAAVDASLQAAIAKRQQLKAILESERASNLPGATPGYAGYQASPTVAVARERLDANVAGIAELMEYRRNLRIRDAVRDAGAAADPLKAINNRYDDMAEAAKRAAAGNDALSRSLKGTLTGIEKQRAAALKAEQDSRRNGRNPADQAARRAEYGEDIGKKIANISDQFVDLPTGVTRANKAMRELKDISSDLARRDLTPNVKSLIDQIGRARAVINESLNRPFNDFLESARQSAEIDNLLLAGRDDEAAALKIILDLKEKQRPLDEAQIDAVLATVRAERERAMVLRDQRALIAANVAAVQDFRGALEQTVADTFRGRFSIERVLSSIGNSYINIMSQKVVEGLFGDTLRQLEAQASGADKVDAAGVRIAGSLDKGASAVEGFAERVNRALVAISGEGPSLETGGILADAGRSISDMFSKVADDVAARVAQKAGGVPEASGDEIVVTANKSRKVDQSGTASFLFGMVEKAVGELGVKIPVSVSQSIKGVLAKLEQSLPQALQGAFTGTAASRIMLGDKGVGGTIGSAIGGALGQKVGEKFLSKGLESVAKGLGSFAGPLGSVLGGVLGGALGGLFKKTQWGSAALVNGETTSSGNKADYTSSANTAAGTVAGAINQIAERLGASVGDYAVSIGLTNGNWNVNPGVVNGKIGTKWQNNTIDFKKDEAGALSWAIGNAISDGAIEGVSAAVAKALKSSSDIDKALAEALKVQDVEILIGGIGAEMEKAFRDFENQAKERLRIGREYGFDLVALEKRNAEDRLKLSEQLLKEQAGSLQDLIEEMTSGSLFEGSAVEQRDALLAQIATVKVKAAAGEDGAADELAQLLQQFNSVSRDAYGTTGGFAADRATILDVSRDVLAKANQRIADAQAATDPALAETNTQLDEVNDQLSKLASLYGLSVEYLKAIAAGGTISTSALADLAGYR